MLIKDRITNIGFRKINIFKFKHKEIIIMDRSIQNRKCTELVSMFLRTGICMKEIFKMVKYKGMVDFIFIFKCSNRNIR